MHFVKIKCNILYSGFMKIFHFACCSWPNFVPKNIETEKSNFGLKIEANSTSWTLFEFLSLSNRMRIGFFHLQRIRLSTSHHFAHYKSCCYLTKIVFNDAYEADMWQMDYRKRHFSAMNRRSVRTFCVFFLYFPSPPTTTILFRDRETEWFFITSVYISTSSEKSLHLMQSYFLMAHHWCEYSKFQGHFAFKRAMLNEWQLGF